ncbi:hypothetical protein BDW75DRAFT_197104 [Aspergillus navahoensis]
MILHMRVFLCLVKAVVISLGYSTRSGQKRSILIHLCLGGCSSSAPSCHCQKLLPEYSLLSVAFAGYCPVAVLTRPRLACSKAVDDSLPAQANAPLDINSLTRRTCQSHVLLPIGHTGSLFIYPPEARDSRLRIVGSVLSLSHGHLKTQSWSAQADGLRCRNSTGFCYSSSQAVWTG